MAVLCTYPLSHISLRRPYPPVRRVRLPLSPATTTRGIDILSMPRTRLGRHGASIGHGFGTLDGGWLRFRASVGVYIRVSVDVVY